MPFATIGGAERLMATLAESLAADGDDIIVTTSLPMTQEMPDGVPAFRAVTDHVYELPRDQQCTAVNWRTRGVTKVQIEREGLASRRAGLGLIQRLHLAKADLALL